MDSEIDIYAHLVFSEGDIRFMDHYDPIPNWPFKSLSSLTELTEYVSTGTTEYFSNLTVGQFLCLIETAKNFEAYGKIVVSGSADTVSTTWYEISTHWLSHFTNSSVECKALRALYNRRIKHFKDMQKHYNARGNTSVKEALVKFLNGSLVLPKKKIQVTVDKDNSVLIQQQNNDADVSMPVSRTTEKINQNVIETLRRNKQNQKKISAQSTIIQNQISSVNALTSQNKILKSTVINQNKELKKIGPETRNTIEEIEKLKVKNQLLQQKSRDLRITQMKLKSKEKEFQNLNRELSKLKSTTSEVLDEIENRENERTALNEKLVSVKKKLHRTKKKVQRREKNISVLHDKIEKSRSQFETDKEALELYYEGIVHSMKNQHMLSEEIQNCKLQEMKQLETKKNGKYKGEVRLLYYDLLTKGVSANTIQDVVRSVLDNLTELDMNNVQLPGRSTAQRMVSEAGALVKIRAAYELAREKAPIVHQSDGTTKNFIHWGAHAIKLLPNDDPQNPKFFTLTVSPVVSGKADDTVEHLQEQFSELRNISEKLNLHVKDDTYSLMRVNGRMSDRAANEKRVTKLIEERKDELYTGTLGESEYETSVHSFTCAAHKINNMALAMTEESAKYLYDRKKGTRGMIGAKKHIYECNKLLCEHARKEYGLGVDFKAYSLCQQEDTGSQLFKPIVGNRYLIFLQNSIPTLAAYELVLMFLEDVKDSKETPGLNRLEHSVQQGYLHSSVQAEELAFALIYYYVCAPLLQKAKSVKSPLEMNKYYSATIEKLHKWSRDPSGLVSGCELIWEGATGPDVYRPYLATIHAKSASSALVPKILKEMARAGKEKLKSHAEEHLDGGIFSDPTPSMVTVANTLADATNDRIESMFGMLDRQMMIAPSSNPVNVSSLVSAKQDKPVDWIRNADVPVDQICNVAMSHARVKRQQEGTRTDQIKRRFLAKKTQRDALIKKRRRIRAEREQKKRTLIQEAKIKLCSDVKKVKKMNKTKQVNQVQMWKAVSTVVTLKKVEILNGVYKMSESERVSSLKKIIKRNRKVLLKFQSKGNDSDWDSSDDETLIMFRKLKPSNNINKTGYFEHVESDCESSEEEMLDMSRLSSNHVGS